MKPTTKPTTTQTISPTVTTGPLPASRRVWQTGDRHKQIRVPMRAIDLHPSAGEAPVTVYDSSGPYTDPEAEVAIEDGLPAHRVGHRARRCGAL